MADAGLFVLMVDFSAACERFFGARPYFEDRARQIFSDPGQVRVASWILQADDGSEAFARIEINFFSRTQQVKLSRLMKKGLFASAGGSVSPATRCPQTSASRAVCGRVTKISMIMNRPVGPFQLSN